MDEDDACIQGLEVQFVTFIQPLRRKSYFQTSCSKEGLACAFCPDEICLRLWVCEDTDGCYSIQSFNRGRFQSSRFGQAFLWLVCSPACPCTCEALEVCERSSCWQDAVDFFREMQSHQIQQDVARRCLLIQKERDIQYLVILGPRANIFCMGDCKPFWSLSHGASIQSSSRDDCFRDGCTPLCFHLRASPRSFMYRSEQLDFPSFLNPSRLPCYPKRIRNSSFDFPKPVFGVIGLQ